MHRLGRLLAVDCLACMCSDRWLPGGPELLVLGGGDEAGFVGEDCGLDAVADVEFLEHVCDVGFDGRFAEDEFCGTTNGSMNARGVVRLAGDRADRRSVWLTAPVAQRRVSRPWVAATIASNGIGQIRYCASTSVLRHKTAAGSLLR